MSDLTKLLIGSLIKQRLGEPERQRVRDERAAELSQARELDLVRSAVESGANESDIWKLQALTPNIPTPEFEGYAKLAGLRAKKIKQDEAVGKIMDPAQLSQLGARFAPTAGAQGQLVQPDPAQSTGGTDLAMLTKQLVDSGREDLVPLLMSRVGGAREATAQSTTEGLARETRTNAAAESAAIRSEGRTEATATRNQTVGALAEVLSGGDPVSANAALEASLRTNPKGFGAIVDRAIVQSEALKAKELKETRTPIGRDVPTRLAESIERIRASNGAEYAGRSFDEAFLEANKAGFRDPVTQRIAISDSPELKKRRSRLVSLPPLVNAFEETIAEIGKEVADNKMVTAGGLMGGDMVANAARKLGVQSKGVARFQPLQQQLLLQLARMDQDARLSDFDLARWLAVIPGLQDLSFDANGQLSEQAQGRLESIRQMIELESKYGLGDIGSAPPAGPVTPQAREAARVLQADPSAVGEATRILNTPSSKIAKTPEARGKAAVDEFYINRGSQ